MDRAEILAAAQRCVCGERQQDYGTPENSFRVIGELWETYIKEKCASVGAQIEIIPEDVAALLGLMKIARIATGHGKDDNWVDLAGYAACGGELQGADGYVEQEPVEQLACKHDWESDGVNTGGFTYHCRKCGARKTEPYETAKEALTNGT